MAEAAQLLYTAIVAINEDASWGALRPVKWLFAFSRTQRGP
jgi:hypothetical protein